MKHSPSFLNRQALRRAFIHLSILLALLAPVLAHPASALELRIQLSLRLDAAAHPNDTFRVIVTRLNQNPRADSLVAALAGTKVQDLVGDAFVAELLGKDLPILGSDPAVKFITLDAPMVYTGAVDAAKLATLYTSAVNATSLWSGTSGVTGRGVGVAVVDTGITNRCDFNGSDGVTRIVAKGLFSSDPEQTGDGFGHGTHVAGIIAGNSWNCPNQTIKGKYVGVAPEANLINVRVANEDGLAYTSDVINAIDWVIQNRQQYNIRVLNLSLVSSVPESYHTSLLDAIVEKAWFSGIFVTVAAGNAGPNTMGFPPANDPFVMTVGAADPKNSISQNDDRMAPWSSYGLTQDLLLKPDVVAPGRYIVAPLAGPYARLAAAMPDRLVDGSYMRLSGTSMASPIVAGIAALAFQKHPEWTNDQLKWVLMNTTTVLGGLLPEPGQGAGEVNAAKVVNYNGTPRQANQGLLVNERVLGPTGLTLYTSGLLTPAVTWSTSTWSTSTWSTSTWSTSTWSTSTWSTSSKWAGTGAE